ncbi:MAG: transcriptional regulatory protein devR [Symbiobacteriaceae bacterium]|jgi:DNA-binding NarL/FixJ family response regulator|nr:transcriptional regulatory protein devR [Symbiobacteriaceae bacterium]
MTTVMVVDDHSVVRMGLIALLSRAPGFAVVGEAGRVAEALEKAEALVPDVVLMDVRLPDGSGIECCRAIRTRRPETKVLMLTSYDDRDAAIAAVMAGAAGYLLKQVEPEELLRAVRLVAGGACLLDSKVASGVLEYIRRGSPEGDLSERERSILHLIGEGMTNREIAARLFLSEKTVRNYVSIILQKMGLSNRTQAAAYVSRRRLLGGESEP